LPTHGVCGAANAGGVRRQTPGAGFLVGKGDVVLALIHLALGDVDASFEWLDRAHDERSGWLPYLAMEPRLAPLRHDARFKRLLERIGLTRSLHHSPCGP
jgi:hypothetical protein